VAAAEEIVPVCAT